MNNNRLDRKIYKRRVISIMGECLICSVTLTDKNIAKHEDGRIRKDSSGKEWCQKCTDENDNIDWDEVNNSRLSTYGY